MSGFSDLVNNTTFDTHLKATLNWGTTQNNGNLIGATYNHGGPSYPAFLTFTDAFSYDGVNRMLTATDTTVIGGKTTPEWSRGFTYDAYGNASISGSLNPPSLNYDLSHNQIAVAGVSYDAAGNQTTVTMNTLVYDAENRITTETDHANPGVTTHTYDGNWRSSAVELI